VYYARKSEGRKVGYSVVDFRIEDGKAVSEIKAYDAPHEVGGPGMTWHLDSTQRHVETLDGRPLICHIDIPGYRKRTYTVGDDGKVRLIATDDPTTQPAVEETITWPEDALLWHGHYLLTRRKGMKEGTAYTCKVFSDGKSELVHVRVGPRRKMVVSGREMELTEVIHMEKPSDDSQEDIAVKAIMYLDDDLIAQKIEVDVGQIKFAMIACSKAEAMKLPAAAPTGTSRFWEKLKRFVPAIKP